MPLPFESEPLEALQGRFAQALTPVYQVEDLLKKRSSETGRVGQQRKHVFDFEHGIRLILSVEHLPPSQPYLHASFSGIPPASIKSEPELMAYLHQTLMELAKGRLPVAQIQTTPGGVYHFFYDNLGDLFQKFDPAEKQAVQSGWLGRARIR